MKTTYLYIALALLILSEGIILWKNHQQKKEIALKDHYMERLVTSAQTMESAFQSSVENAGQQIYGNITARDTADNAIPLAEIAKNTGGNLLICRYSERMCRECVEHSISVINDSISHFDISRILFLAENSSRRVFKLNIDEYGLQGCPVLNCPNLGIPAEEAMFPYIMAVDSSLRVLSVYFPTKSTHGTDYDYRHVKYMYDKLIH